MKSDEADARLWWFDKQGQAITLERRFELMQDDAYARVDYTQITDDIFVSTVWIGEDALVTGHLAEGLAQPRAPRIFETIVNNRGEWTVKHHYATEAEALDGHRIAVAALRALVHEVN